MGLSKKSLIRSSREFKSVFDNGTKIVTEYFVLYSLRINSPKKSKQFGFIASKKIGGAVQRNRAKRLLKETVRKKLDLFPAPSLNVFIARRMLTDAKQHEIEEIFQKKLAHLNHKEQN